jgi:hypothetical protein
MDRELLEILKDLVYGVAADTAVIIAAPASGPETSAADPDELPADGEVRAVPLGRGAVLRVHFLGQGSDDTRAAAIERAARAIRACSRRWGSDLPHLSYQRQRALERHRIRERIEVYLQAFANAQGVSNALVTADGDVVAAARPVSADQQQRLPFLAKQVEAEIRNRRGETSHVEVIREDVCAFSFWINACLIAFCDGTFSPDFMRHRARLVMREISHLLPHLDEPPDAPAKLAPVPE